MDVEQVALEYNRHHANPANKKKSQEKSARQHALAMARYSIGIVIWCVLEPSRGLLMCQRYRLQR